MLSILPSQDVLSGYNNFNYVDGAPTNDSCNVTRYVMGLSIAAGVTYGQTFDVRGVLLNKQAVYITCTFVGAYESGGITQFAKFKRGAFLANANTIASAVNQVIDTDVGSNSGSPPAGMDAEIVWVSANRVKFNLTGAGFRTYWTIYVEAVEVTSAS